MRPTAPIAADALLPGDPARALHLAQELLRSPKMSNHAHGLWGYGGRTEQGHELTVQSIGIGGPSSAMVLAQLGALGVRRAIQVGTCRAVARGLRLGEVVAVREAIGADGVSRELGAGSARAPGPKGESPEPSVDRRLAPDGKLGTDLARIAEEAGLRAITVASTDVLGALDGRPAQRWAERGAAALEMSSAALFATGPRCGVAVAALLAVTEVGEETIEEEPLKEASTRMGRLAVAALSSCG